MSDDVLVRAEGISKKFCRDLKRSLWYGVKDALGDLTGRDGSTHDLRPSEFWALDDVSFELRRGECLGLIGRNGAGKTTLLKLLNGLIKPDRGRIEMRGRVGALIALGAGFNPVLTGRENIYVNASILGLSRREIDRQIGGIIDFADIGEFIDAPVQSYSSGMSVRLGFAVATAVELDVLLLDEVLAVGDASFQAKCYQKLGTMLTRAAVILVSHNPYHIKKICNQALLLEQGNMVATGLPDPILRAYAERDINAPEALELTHAAVIGAEVQCLSEKLSYGGTLQLKLRIEVSQPISCDLGYLNIADEGGVVHAQAILCERPLEFERGSSEVVISVGPLCLSEGKFFGNLVMMTTGGKETLVHSRNLIRFSNSGPLSMGAFYYPQVVVYVLPTNSTNKLVLAS